MSALLSLLFAALVVVGTLTGCRLEKHDSGITMPEMTQTADHGLRDGAVRLQIGIRGSDFTKETLTIAQDKGLLLRVTNNDNRPYRMGCHDDLLPPSPIPARGSVEFAIFAPSTGTVRCDLLAENRDLIVGSMILEVAEAPP